MGILDTIKGLFSGGEQSTGPDDFYRDFVDDAFRKFTESGKSWYNYNLSDYPELLDSFKALDSFQKSELLIYCLQTKLKNPGFGEFDGNHSYEKNTIRDSFANAILKSRLEIHSGQFEKLLDCMIGLNARGVSFYGISNAYLIRQFSSMIVKIEEATKQEELIEKLEKVIYHSVYQGTKEKEKLQVKIREIRNLLRPEADRQIQFFAEGDLFSSEMNGTLCSGTEDQLVIWDKLFALARTGAGGSKPSAKFLKESNHCIKELGPDLFKASVSNWCAFIVQIPEGRLTNADVYFEHAKPESAINTINTQLMRSFVWMCSHFHDAGTLNTIYKLAERSYKKVPNIGQESTSLGNACVYALFSSKGLDGIGLLSRLRLKIRHNSTQTLILKYLHESAVKKGVSLSEIEDMATDDFGLIDGEKTYLLGDYKAVLRIEKVGKCVVIWEKENGSIQKSIPAQLKTTHAEKIKKIKAVQKQIEQTLSAQRDRIDRLFRIDRAISSEHFKKYYLEHGLLSFLAKKLIWIFENESGAVSVGFKDGVWLNPESISVSLDAYQRVRLWHPALSSVEEVQYWREFLIRNEIQQPLKQAFREVYLLTEAELRTRNYSNRMAAHILKQHQFVNLARGRNWTVGLQGAWDGFGDQNARLEIPEFGITAAYWIEGLYAEDSYNDQGILNYVSTDQIRFTKTGAVEPMDLIDVPKVLFSEVLRDTDLFVGVASIGNDPNWQDSANGNRYQEYWSSYSFGELSEVAKNRKAILEGLVPRLKIAAVCELKDRFLIVKGKIRTYKIHIGSTNILMEPNDQYLCIVPDRGSKTVSDNLFIPFEGDQGLALIISKAMLLAEDDQITDSSIVSQIQR